MDFVSIIMPTYNKADYLAVTLESFLSQTNQKYEMVIVDDGSNDQTANVVDHYSRLLPIRYKYQENKGRSAARNAALNIAKSDIIVFCDDDRMPVPTYVEDYIDLLRDEPKRAIIGWKEEIYTVNDFGIRQTEKLAELRVAYGNSKYLFHWDDIKNNYFELLINQHFRTPYDNYEFVIDKYGEELEGFIMPYAIATSGNMGYNRKAAPDEQMEINFLGWGCEDNEFAYRLMLKGYKFITSKKVQNYHQRHPTNDPARRDMFLRNMAFFALKYPNLDIYMLWNSFQSKDRSFNYIHCNETYKLLKNTNDVTLRRFADHLVSSWVNGQREIYNGFNAEERHEYL